MSLPLLNVTLGFIKQHLLQSFLLITGIAFGVALIISVDIANQSASRSFSLSSELLSANSTHRISSSYSHIDESLYQKLKVDLGINSIAPVVEDYVNVPALDGRAVRLLGTDFFSDLIFYGGSNSPVSNIPPDILTALMTRPGSALVSPDLVRSMELKPGDNILLIYGSDTITIRVLGVIETQDTDLADSLGGLILSDISTAQELLGKTSNLSRIDLIIDRESPSGPKTLESIKSILPAGIEIKARESFFGSAKNLTRSFELNLAALSLLALFVGIFLIYNIVSFSVIQRRSAIGTLRSIGATRGQIFKMIIFEALAIGIIGSLIGAAGGVVLGKSILTLVTRSINDLYYTLTVTSFSVSPETLVKGLLAGIAASLLAAAVPAYEASRIRPFNVIRRSGFESFFSRSIKLLSIPGVVFIGLAYLAILLPTKSIVLSLASVFLILFGVSLLVPILTALLMKALSLAASSFGVIVRMSPRNIIRSLSRTAVAVASLTVAISVILSVSIMIGSFRTTVVSWLDTVLTADIFISMDASNASSQAGLDPEIISVVENTSGIDRVATVRRVLYDSPEYGVFNLVAVTKDLAVDNRDFIWNESGNGALWDKMNDGSVVISEAFAYKNDIKPEPGAALTLVTDKGERVFKVSGIYYDYGAQTGVVLVSDDLFRSLWNDDRITSLGVYLSDAREEDTLLDNLRTRLSGFSNLVIRSNGDLKKSAIKTFDRTFTVTSALRLLIAIVAFISVLSSLMALQLERGREFGILRAVGMRVSQLRSMLFLENGLIGLTAGLFSIPVGLVLSLILIYVINLRSFGWTLNFSLEPGYFLEALGIAVIASLAAGIYPAYLIGRQDVGKLIREE